MSNMNKELPNNIVRTGYGKTALSFLLDVVFTAVLMVCCYLIANPIVKANMNVDAKKSEYETIIKASNLFVEKSGGYSVPIYPDESTDYKTAKQANVRYNEMITSYFEDFIGGYTGEGIGFLESDKFTGERTNKQDVGNWILSSFYKVDASSAYFETTLSADYKPVIKSNLTDEQEAALLRLFVDTDNNAGYMAEASIHFQKQPLYQSLLHDLNLANYISLIPGFVISPLVFFMLLPMLISNGRTLGKLIMGASVIGSDGYKARKWQFAIHYGIFVLEWWLLLLVYFNTAIAFTALILLWVVDYMVMVLNRRHMSIHNLLARTISVSTKDSMWFASAEDENTFIESHPDSALAKSRGFTKKDDNKIVRRMVTTEEDIIASEEVLDLNTINKNREEARNMTSFDEFENKDNK